MRVYADVNGAVVRASAGTEVGDPVVAWTPFLEGTAATLDFDTSTNFELSEDVTNNRGAYSLVAGVLLKNGTPVAINAPGQYVQDKQKVAQMADQLDTFLASLDGGQTLSAADVQKAIRFLLRFARYVLKLIARRGL